MKNDDYIEIFTPEELSKIKNLGISESIKYINDKRSDSGIKLLSKLDNLESKRKIEDELDIITLKSENFNSLLNGGFKKLIYLLYGKYASGKSQICHHLCASIIKEIHNKTNDYEILFIDTENTFRPGRIIEILEDYPYLNSNSAEELLKNIKVFQGKNTNIITMILNSLIKEKKFGNTKILIIDSFTKHIRLDIADENTSLMQTQKALVSILRSLRFIKETMKIPVILTSQVKSISSELPGFSIRPILEYILNEYTDESILLSKPEDNSKACNYAYLVNSISSPEKSIEFKISKEGIIDP